MSGFIKSIFGGGGGSKPSGGGGGGGGGAKKLFTPEQVTKVTKDYTSQGNAKWNQIMAGMGAGGGTGGDFSAAIADQAKGLGTQLADLTDQSGYGDNGLGQLDTILKNLEGGLGAKYPVY